MEFTDIPNSPAVDDFVCSVTLVFFHLENNPFQIVGDCKGRVKVYWFYGSSVFCCMDMLQGTPFLLQLLVFLLCCEISNRKNSKDSDTRNA